MATSTYTASELKTCRNGSSWRSDYNYAGIGQSYEYDSAPRFGYLGFSFNLSGKYITKIVFKFTFDTAGLGDWKSKSMDFYRYVSSSSAPSTVGSYIGGFSGTGMCNCTTSYTFDSATNASCFTGLKSYFEGGGCGLIIKAPNTDSKTHSYGDYSDSYALIKAATVTIDYVDKYTITYNTTANGGSGSITATTLASGIDGSVTTSTPTAPGSSTVNAYTVTYNGNGGTPSKTSDTNTVTRTYKFTGWNTAQNGSGTSYASGGSINISSNITLYAQYAVNTTTYNNITSPTATRGNETNTRTITYNINGGTISGKTSHSQTSSSTTSYSCLGWYSAASGGTKVVNTNTAYNPGSTRTLYAQWNPSSTAYPSVTLPTPVREGYVFDGWYLDDTKIGNAGAAYTPTSSITLTAAWIANKHQITVKDNMLGETLYEATLDYGTTFTVPTYSRPINALPNYSEDAYVNFIDDETGYNLETEQTRKQNYRHNGQFALFIDGNFTYASEGKEYYNAGDRFTITQDVELSLVWVEDGHEYIQFTTPVAPATIFGKHFQGWTSTDNGVLYSPNTVCTIEDPPLHLDMLGTWIDTSANYGKNLYLKVGGQMKQGTAFVKVSGQYKEAIAVFVKKNGVWKTHESTEG